MALSFKIHHFVCVFVLLSFIALATARATDYFEFGEPQEDKCNLDDIEVCQLCAKQTKSRIVYPMCCRHEDDALEWCKQYIDYGKTWE